MNWMKITAQDLTKDEFGLNENLNHLAQNGFIQSHGDANGLDVLQALGVSHLLLGDKIHLFP